MFRIPLLIGISLWLIGGLLSVLYFYSSSFESQQNYQSLIQLSKQGEKAKAERQFRETKQKRFQISKQYLFQQEGQRLQWRLTSQNSELVLLPKKHSQKGLSETFRNMHCLMQEKIYPQQILKELHAQEATYSYPLKELKAENVQISRYVLPTSEWQEHIPSQALMLRGTAQKIQLISSPKPQLKAQGFHATIHQWENE